MKHGERSEALRRALFEQPQCGMYAVLDGAAIEQLPVLIAEHGVEHVCLLRGELDPELAQVAPYLVELPADSSLTNLLTTTGWGKDWGIFVLSRRDFRRTRMHLRQFLEVWDPEGKPLFFRFYDPRVLRVFLPTCDEEQLKQLFGDVVSAYFAEGEDGDALLRFVLAGDGLSQSEIPIPKPEVL